MSQVLGTGRRKTSVARAFIEQGEGQIIINNKNVDEYFSGRSNLISIIKRPLLLTKLQDSLVVKINVYGGGLSGQAGAIRHGIARALLKYNEELKPILKSEKLLTRDSRMVERKKYGKKKARKSPQFVKR